MIVGDYLHLCENIKPQVNLSNTYTSKGISTVCTENCTSNITNNVYTENNSLYKNRTEKPQIVI